MARALQYANVKSITNLYNQNSDEFSAGMSLVIDSVTNGINDSSRRMRIRIFSLRGAHPLAMFARTPVAKEFRRWVLDILGQEVMTRGLPAKERVAVLCPCCGKPASVIGTNYLTLYRVEIIVECNRSDCTNQKFKSEISFSYYIEQKDDSRMLGEIICALSPHQKQTLIRMLSAPV
ncbi:hypothetical protein JFB36_09895 [Dickeya solani]|uniref:Bro-N domain-containing protein n=1 Tax=Dickeya solani D s0432-1 TaxID=1231725 RepID=A0AAV3KFM0_9GAMM|nr:hypothetical protein A4U42_12150 [Dickeya solani IPO 2222]AUH08570.1 hypothetical protein BJD21_08885 [Dickeya solani D s0432-1]AUH12566.1 hypothetical protein BJJ98_08850 [Dickeya solani]ERO59630.1 hypothetical protein A544_0603 [Dickeya solani D s0432-1]MBD3603915.1 hypothetical protein [Dickeya solani]